MHRGLMAAAMIAALPLPAFAQQAAPADSSPADNSPHAYFGVGYSTMVTDASAVLGVLTARGGVSFNPYMSIESEGAVGVMPQQYSGGGQLNLDSEFGAFLVARAPLSPQAELYARAGAARLSFSSSYRTASAYGSDSAIAYGGGFSWNGQYLISRFEVSRYQFSQGGGVTAVTTTLEGKF